MSAEPDSQQLAGAPDRGPRFDVPGGRAGRAGVVDGDRRGALDWELLGGDAGLVLYPAGCRWSAPDACAMTRDEILHLARALARERASPVDLAFDDGWVRVPPGAEPPRLSGFTPEQRALWDCVCALWDLSQQRDARAIAQRLHPEYAGWDLRAPRPHDRDEAVRSVTDDAPRLARWSLRPLSVRVYDGAVGVVHYTFRATVEPPGRPAAEVTGRWTEVWSRAGGQWRMVAVSGRPDDPDLA